MPSSANKAWSRLDQGRSAPAHALLAQLAVMRGRSMHESAALEVSAVRAIETAGAVAPPWTDADRAWASHAAAAAVGEAAAPEVFLAQRARLALQRLQPRHPGLRRAVAGLGWRPWVALVVVLGAFLLGLVVDRVGDTQRVNILAPPVLLLLVWNLAVFMFIVVARFLPVADGRMTDPVRHTMERLGAGWRGVRPRSTVSVGAWLADLSLEWARLAAPLYRVRAARVLHLAAAALASGVIAGMYLRGLALEYRATWESTFLDPALVHALLSVALAPGAWLGGLTMPDVAQVAAIRAPGSENAAPWLHLMSLTLLAIVVLPRLCLATIAWGLERRRAATMSLPLEHPYFRRLLRAFHVEPAQVWAIAYGFTPSSTSIAGLEALLSRLLGGAATIYLGAPVGYGEEDDPALRKLPAQSGPVVALFNLAATPEREAHAAFAAALKADCSTEQPLLAIVDETSFKARAGDDPQRMEQRRAAWRDMLATVQVVPVFVDLSTPDLPTADAALDLALSRP